MTWKEVGMGCVRVVPSRNWKTWNPEPRTWPGFETLLCSKTNPAKWCDDVTKSSHLYQVPGKKPHFWKYKKKKNRNLAASHWTWNVMKCDENVTSLHFVCCFVLLNRYWGIVTVPGFLHERHCPSLKPRSRFWANSDMERPSVWFFCDVPNLRPECQNFDWSIRKILHSEKSGS